MKRPIKTEKLDKLTYSKKVAYVKFNDVINYYTHHDDACKYEVLSEDDSWNFYTPSGIKLPEANSLIMTKIPSYYPICTKIKNRISVQYNSLLQCNDRLFDMSKVRYVYFTVPKSNYISLEREYHARIEEPLAPYISTQELIGVNIPVADFVDLINKKYQINENDEVSEVDRDIDKLIQMARWTHSFALLNDKNTPIAFVLHI